MQTPFRFIHASDLHLERPPRGLAEVSDALRALLVEAPYRAAERIFDSAIKERVDFLLLSGDVIDPLAAGPRGLLFLTEQFRRLADKDIKTYWAGGRRDDFERWRDFGPLAEVVERFPVGRVSRFVHTRNDVPLAQILGASTQQRKRIRAAEFTPEGNLFSVAVAYGTADAELLADRSMRYWALGGDHERRNLLQGPIVAHYPGTPQGRRPQETGPRGCTLVHVDEDQRCRLSLIATEAVRYQTEHVEVGESATADQLQQIIAQRVDELASDPFGPDLLVQWIISGSATLDQELRHGTLAADLTARLRSESHARRPLVWTVGLEAEPANLSESMLDEETVLGEFLRTVKHYAENADDPLNLEPLLAERHLAGSLGAMVALDDPALRQRVLLEVARLGVELLGPRDTR